MATMGICSPHPTSRQVVGSAMSSGSPHKPRLLWRGDLLLPDGTALPGIAFVSNAQPTFSSGSSEPSQRVLTSSSSSSSQQPFTLSKEQQDDLSLSIEMVRHAPINIIEVIEKVDRDEKDGTMLKPKRVISSNPKENSDQFRVTYEASGGIRAYVDPASSSTVAYMERLFCYEEKSDDDDDDEGEVVESEGREYRSTDNVIVLSLDRSYRYILPSPTDIGDVFSELVASSSSPSSLSSSSSSSINAFKSSGSSSATEAVLMGVKTKTEHGTTIDLHIGQKVIRKVAREGPSALTMDQRQSSRFGLRPDDPAPRGLSRVLSAKYRSTPPVLARRSSSSSSSSSPFVAPNAPASRDFISGTKRPIISVLSDEATARPHSMPNLKRHSSSDHHPMSTADSKDGKKRAKTLLPESSSSDEINGKMGNENDETISINHSGRKIEELNRSLIKKLVHHQLLGKGLEKKDEDYLACFNPTCNGTVLALRKHFKTKIIEKAIAANVIEKHLELYL